MASPVATFTAEPRTVRLVTSTALTTSWVVPGAEVVPNNLAGNKGRSHGRSSMDTTAAPTPARAAATVRNTKSDPTSSHRSVSSERMPNTATPLA